MSKLKKENVKIMKMVKQNLYLHRYVGRLNWGGYVKKYL
ncbi:hypothetical protein SVI_3771 [Shewanella violacea DSS12]|uniref:Uncharacterized protein n=1 Tax=Shewanella violacea (strain JCM 10179 / CIP 106290 / LMG 19151 / DSS12) TaxID=637905 RepID=D4ZCJ7_SHEVD|nr:hypothetical protein SVI_3771 [Shewanella violacea DSS12]